MASPAGKSNVSRWPSVGYCVHRTRGLASDTAREEDELGSRGILLTCALKTLLITGHNLT